MRDSSKSGRVLLVVHLEKLQQQNIDVSFIITFYSPLSIIFELEGAPPMSYDVDIYRTKWADEGRCTGGGGEAGVVSRDGVGDDI